MDAPAPATVDDSDEPPALPLSTLNVPVTYDVSPILADLERAIPYRWGDIEERLAHPANGRIHYAFEAERSRFTAALRADTARISATIRYRGRGWYDPPIAPEISASCGASEARDDRPRAIVSLSAHIGLTEDWTLKARSRVEGVAPVTRTARDACRVTAFRINVTDRVIVAARTLLEDNTPVIDRSIAGLDVRSRFEEWWDLVRTPIALTDSVWLLINPVAVRRGAVTSNGLRLTADVGLSAAPRIVVGRRPILEDRPLPRLDSATMGDGLHILIEGVVDYAVASEILTRELEGRTLELGDHTLRLRGLRISGIGGGRLAVEVRFDGSARGRIYFVGRPRFDPGTNEVFVPDLDFDVATSHLLVSGYDWLKHDDLTRLLRENARFPVADAINEAHALLDVGLNRNLSRDVRSRARCCRCRRWACTLHGARSCCTHTRTLPHTSRSGIRKPCSELTALVQRVDRRLRSRHVRGSRPPHQVSRRTSPGVRARVHASRSRR